MQLTVLDYSSDYYAQQGLALPDERQGKFVLLHCKPAKQHYALFAPFDMAGYHANIVAYFCQQQNIAGQYNRKQDEFEVWDDAWQVMGGGRWRLDSNTSTLKLFGTSIAYGGLDLVSLANALHDIGAFEGVMLLVE